MSKRDARQRGEAVGASSRRWRGGHASGRTARKPGAARQQGRNEVEEAAPTNDEPRSALGESRRRRRPRHEALGAPYGADTLCAECVPEQSSRLQRRPPPKAGQWATRRPRPRGSAVDRSPLGQAGARGSPRSRCARPGAGSRQDLRKRKTTTATRGTWGDRERETGR